MTTLPTLPTTMKRSRQVECYARTLVMQRSLAIGKRGRIAARKLQRTSAMCFGGA
jgi:hypothetical protein